MTVIADAGTAGAHPSLKMPLLVEPLAVATPLFFMNVNMSIIPFLWKMFKCKHCDSSFASIRTARNHHVKCIKVKGSQLACRDLSGCACDSCFDEPSQPIAFEQMAPILAPGEPDSASSESAFERATSFGKKATMLFTHVRFCSKMEDSDSNAAWQVMTELQDIAENCCSMAAVLVHRNKSDTGLKKKPFKPLRGMHSAYVTSLELFLKFCKDMYPGTYQSDLHILTEALQEPASPTEPRIIQFLIYMYGHEDMKDPDDFQHACMHLQRVFRCVCLRLLQNASDADLNIVTEALLSPKRANSFAALFAIYRTAKELVKRWLIFVSPVWFLIRLHYVCRYGEVRVWNAEVRHRPAGHELDPRSAVYVRTGKENASFTFSLLFDETSSFIRPFAHSRSCGTWSALK
jgi:hypothetical protein